MYAEVNDRRVVNNISSLLQGFPTSDVNLRVVMLLFLSRLIRVWLKRMLRYSSLSVYRTVHKAQGCDSSLSNDGNSIILCNTVFVFFCVFFHYFLYLRSYDPCTGTIKSWYPILIWCMTEVGNLQYYFCHSCWNLHSAVDNMQQKVFGWTMTSTMTPNILQSYRTSRRHHHHHHLKQDFSYILFFALESSRRTWKTFCSSTGYINISNSGDRERTSRCNNRRA